MPTPPKLSGSGDVIVNQSGKTVMIYKRNQGGGPGGGLPVTPTDPFRRISFYSYASGRDVFIVGGHVVIPIPTGAYGVFGVLDSGIPDTTFTDLVPGQTGWIVFKYALELTDDLLAQATADDFGVDLGDPSGNYHFSTGTGYRATNEESNTIDGARYGFEFSLDEPEPSYFFFQRIICGVSVSGAGIPTVTPRHFGDIDVPVSYAAGVTAFSAFLEG